MKYIQGSDRKQAVIFPISMDMAIKEDNEVRIIDFFVDMTTMVEKAIEIVGNNKFDAVFDKGYHTAEQIHNCHELGIETHVSIPSPASNAPNKKYNVSEFIYNNQDDTYCCPAAEILRSNGNWYKKRNYNVKQYKTNKCKDCLVKDQCTRSKSQRLIERHEFAEALKKNKEALINNPEIYKQRQAIVEHPFGTMKRQWGFDHIMTKKTKERASSDVGLIFIAYNLRRLISIIGISSLADYLKEALLNLFSYLGARRLNISDSKPSCFLEVIENWFSKQSPKGLYLVKIYRFNQN